MAPAATLDWSEPCQHWRYPKFCPSGQQKHERAKSAMELSSKEANTAYKKFCKFLRRLKHKKRKFFVWENPFSNGERSLAPRVGLGSVTREEYLLILHFRKAESFFYSSPSLLFRSFLFLVFVLSWKLKGDSLFDISNF